MKKAPCRVVITLTGYSRKTEKLVYERAIPEKHWLMVARSLGLRAARDIYAVHPAKESTVKMCSSFLEEPLDDQLDYFIEATALQS